jgi:protein-tyrosine phosphatase
LGCLLQLNALSVTGYYGKDVKEIALKLIKGNYIDLLGTDLHHQKHLDQLSTLTRSGLLSDLFKGQEILNKKLFSKV